MKYFIIVYLIVIVVLIAVVPVKLLTSIQSKCPECGGNVFYSKKKKDFSCPHCGAAIIQNGAPLSQQQP
ncbi:MAG: hypothetical protein M1609_03535 [Firmicutes bacterium]|nr:hypothetical protein [Bacillota bacterium]MCL5057542.1 hypothetical protein [Actinomycetota bacterium]